MEWDGVGDSGWPIRGFMVISVARMYYIFRRPCTSALKTTWCISRSSVHGCVEGVSRIA
jgi:hypothetical protein